MASRSVVVGLLLVWTFGCVQSSGIGSAQSQAGPSGGSPVGKFIQMTESSGFGTSSAVVTTTVAGDGTVRIVTVTYGDTQPDPLTTTVRDLKADGDRVESLFRLIGSTDFFDVTGQEVGPCLPDSGAATLELEVRDGDQFNNVSGGAECLRDRVRDLRRVLDGIDQVVAGGRPQGDPTP